MGDLEIGDLICTPYNGVQKVSNIFEQGENTVYVFHFDDGTSVTCMDNHRFWARANVTEDFREMTAREIMDHYAIDRPYPMSLRRGKTNYIEFPLCGEVELNEKMTAADLPLHPFVLGYISGTGFWHFDKAGIALENNFYMCQTIRALGYRVAYNKKEDYWFIRGLSDENRRKITCSRSRQPARIPHERERKFSLKNAVRRWCRSSAPSLCSTAKIPTSRRSSCQKPKRSPDAGSDSMDEYKELIRSMMGDYRYTHSVNVSEEAVALAKLYGADVNDAYTAGILHDITKELPAKEQLQIIADGGIILDSVQKNAHKLWHSISGSVYVRDKLGIKNPDIINAIRYHTTGRQGMSLLEKIVFIADFTAAERSYNGVEIMREKSRQSLEDAMLFACKFTIGDLSSRELAIHRDQLDCFNELVLNKGKESAV